MERTEERSSLGSNPSEGTAERRSGARLRADVLVRPVAEVVRPLVLGEVAAGDAARELDGMLGPGVPLEDRPSELAHDEDRLGIAGRIPPR